MPIVIKNADGSKFWGYFGKWVEEYPDAREYSSLGMACQAVENLKRKNTYGFDRAQIWVDYGLETEHTV